MVKAILSRKCCKWWYKQNFLIQLFLSIIEVGNKVDTECIHLRNNMAAMFMTQLLKQFDLLINATKIVQLILPMPSIIHFSCQGIFPCTTKHHMTWFYKHFGLKSNMAASRHMENLKNNYIEIIKSGSTSFCLSWGEEHNF